MGLGDITSRDAVLDAIDEYEDLGAETFLQRYGEGLSRELTIDYISRQYAALPVLRVAHRQQAGELLEAAELQDLPAVKATLEKLGFRVLGEVGPVRRSASRSTSSGPRRSSPRASGTTTRARAQQQPVQQQRRVPAEWTVEPDGLRTRKQLASAFGIGLHGVIETSPRAASVLVFSTPSSRSTLDGWLPDGVGYRFTGEGKRGDQTWTTGNQALAQHHEKKWTVRLFEECDEGWQPGGKRYRYLGRFAVDPEQPWTTETAPVDDEHERTVICFRLTRQADESGGSEPAGSVD